MIMQIDRVVFIVFLAQDEGIYKYVPFSPLWN